jgi:hypothetical protein
MLKFGNYPPPHFFNLCLFQKKFKGEMPFLPTVFSGTHAHSHWNCKSCKSLKLILLQASVSLILITPAVLHRAQETVPPILISILHCYAYNLLQSPNRKNVKKLPMPVSALSELKNSHDTHI